MILPQRKREKGLYGCWRHNKQTMKYAAETFGIAVKKFHVLLLNNALRQSKAYE